MHGVDKDLVREQLRGWGFWLRSARSPSQSYTTSRMDSPLTKKRTIKPIFRNELAENLDLIMSFHMDHRAIIILEMYYAKQIPNIVAANNLEVSVRTYTARRYEAESLLMGILSVINAQKLVKTA